MKKEKTKKKRDLVFSVEIPFKFQILVYFLFKKKMYGKKFLSEYLKMNFIAL